MRKTFRLTVQKPSGEIAYDNLVTPDKDQRVTVTFVEDITSDALDVLMGPKGKKKVLKRTFTVTIRKLEGC